MAINHKQNHYVDSFHIDSQLKLILMSYSTLGLYNMYYFYRNFRVYNPNNELQNIAKSILYPIFCFSLLSKLSTHFKDKNRAKLVAMLIATTLVFFAFSGVIFNSKMKYLAFTTFIPMIFANKFLMAVNTQISAKEQQTSLNLSVVEKLIIIIGSSYTTYLLFLALGAE